MPGVDLIDKLKHISKSTYNFLFTAGIIGSLLFVIGQVYFKKYFHPIAIEPAKFAIGASNLAPQFDVCNSSDDVLYGITIPFIFKKPFIPRHEFRFGYRNSEILVGHDEIKDLPFIIFQPDDNDNIRAGAVIIPRLGPNSRLVCYFKYRPSLPTVTQTETVELKITNYYRTPVAVEALSSVTASYEVSAEPLIIITPPLKYKSGPLHYSSGSK